MAKAVNILFVTVLYKCKFVDSKTYQTFLAGHNDIIIFVYDNSHEPQVIDLPNVIYLHDPQNSGLSVAYNKAGRYAKENGYEWLLLLDQDTDFSDIDIKDYKDAIDENPEIKMIAPKVLSGEYYMSPSNLSYKFSRLHNIVPTGIIDLNKFSPINSGMCIDVDAMFKCGGYKEDVFLDYSDYQFVERFRRFYPYAFIIDKTAKQNFSVYSDNTESTMRRYKMFCQSIKACERNTISDSFWLMFVVVKRCVSICFRYWTLEPIRIFWGNYLVVSDQ